MAAKNAVSLSTIRRTVDLLENLGAVSTVHGVGTQVIPLKLEAVRLQHPAVQKLLAMFQEVMQIISLSFEDMVEQLFPQGEDKVSNCIDHLQAQQDQGASFAAFFIGMGFLMHGNANRALGEIWEKLYEVLLLALSLLESQVTAEKMAPLLTVCTESLIHSLQIGDHREFHDTLQELMGLAITTAAEVAAMCPRHNKTSLSLIDKDA